MRISSLIFLGFSFILLLFATTTYINFRQSEKVNENAEYVSLSSTIVKNANRLQRNILNMSSGLRGFLLTGEDYFLQAYDSTTQENKVLIQELFSELSDTSRQYQILKEIEILSNRWLNEFANPLRQAKISSENAKTEETVFNQLYREKIKSSSERELNLQLQQDIREFINEEYDHRERQKMLLGTSVQKTKTISFSLTLASVLLALVIVAFLSFRISRRILQMVNMANLIAGGNYEVHTEATGKDEISRLAHSLNAMASVLSKNISELKRKNRELDQFAHIVSHDMKAPLRGIDNVVSWIEEDHQHELSPRVAEYIGLIKGRTHRGENLIQGLLSYARVGKEELYPEKVNLLELVHEVADNFTNKTQVSISIDPGLPVLYTQRLPLFQVFLNLISNAIKYNDKAHGEVRVYAREHAGFYEFFVKDNGPGIDRIYHDKIFLIFQTLQERDSFESTGVGLAIVKKILDARNESILVHSEPGFGAEFSFTWKK